MLFFIEKKFQKLGDLENFPKIIQITVANMFIDIIEQNIMSTIVLE